MNRTLTEGAVRFCACAYATESTCKLGGYPIIDCRKCADYKEMLPEPPDTQEGANQ